MKGEAMEEMKISSSSPNNQSNEGFLEISDSKLDVSRAQIVGLQAELENQIKARKMAESLNRNWLKSLRSKEGEEKHWREKKDAKDGSSFKGKESAKKHGRGQDCVGGKLLGLEETKRTPPPQFAADSTGVTVSSAAAVHRKASPETENPHIKRGIKGFVEFPRGVRAMNGSKTRQWGSKLECQKAQLSVLLKHKSPTRSNSIVMS
ncbi:hypothetical protein V6N13_046836 [Hibiscus sabdariffa]